MRITVLSDNLVNNLAGFGEHGFSVFIETNKEAFLFDTGSGHVILNNSMVFGKDLRKIQKIFISHGHYDHTGGLPEVLKLIEKGVKVYAHSHIFLDRFAITKKENKQRKRFVGIPYKKNYLESLGAEFIFNSEFIEVGKGVYLTGEVPRKTSFEKKDPRLFAEIDGRIVQDIFLDDQSLIIESKRGLILIFGCAHSGMINIINHVISKMKKERFYAILGGTHLDFLTEEQLQESIKYLKNIEFEKLCVSHCTGLRASFRLYKEFGERFTYAGVGSVLEI